MGTWSGSVSAGYTLSGGGTRSAYMFDRPYPSASRVRLFLRQPADEVRCLILSSADGRTGLEIGVRAANVDIREVTFGSVGGTPVSTDANDTPASATATAAHRLTAGQA